MGKGFPIFADMIKFERFTLDNGLRVIHHPDTSTPLAVINVLYDVGSRDEKIEQTGFAHLFEHLMFGGSINIPNYDSPLQLVGGENNAFTNNDFTNYYLSLPSENVETGFWLESDRMLSLAFSEEILNVQRDVVCEEFKQRYLNQPYGDVWLKMRPLAYTTHPYQWDTIGKELSHIENAKLQDVKDFFHKYYAPNNAILVVAGNISLERTKELCEKWFAPIPSEEKVKRNIPAEPKQTEQRRLVVEASVPANALYMAFHCCSRSDKHYPATDLLSDVLGRGESSRLYNSLVKDKKLFTGISCYQMGSVDPGLIIISGKLSNNVSLIDAENAVWEEIEKIKAGDLTPEELIKVKNKSETSIVFDETNVLNKAMNLAFAELLGDANMVNTELGKFQAVTADEIIKIANNVLTKSNSNILEYHKK